MGSRAYVLDINNYLNIIENIYSKYCIITAPLYFSPIVRYPVERRSGNTTLSTEPFYPWKCVEFVAEALLRLIYNQSKDRKLYRKNPLIPGESKDLNPFAKVPIDEMLCRYVETDMVDLKDIETISEVVDTIYDKEIDAIVNMYQDGIWEFDFESPNVFLIYKGDIRSYRFNELLEYQEVNVLSETR